ncbi:hypothetical protein A3J23_01415 [Candidatus Peregrinibacteria bacterium RIFCSPLOWO2_02_FULL_48_14]|nr:MAG: hypothetical protein A2974_00980 [Candidatus Peregrinibacteria bacterium RIFCSPLOWO2_01_FULL_48_20]OGJ45746.1 MAG: hypothetical protein A3J23_01415 [Candidatus Peregrinibacteria bacterium RIFCSPLOWO2_02_FULL_48_14]
MHIVVAHQGGAGPSGGFHLIVQTVDESCHFEVVGAAVANGVAQKNQIGFGMLPISVGIQCIGSFKISFQGIQLTMEIANRECGTRYKIHRGQS